MSEKSDELNTDSRELDKSGKTMNESNGKDPSPDAEGDEIKPGGGLKLILSMLLLCLVILSVFWLYIILSRVYNNDPTLRVALNLIVATLFAGVGAVIGGTAAVRGTFDKFGIPIDARFGGAAAMFVGIAGVMFFLVPNLGANSYALAFGRPTYIQKVPDVYTIEINFDKSIQYSDVPEGSDTTLRKFSLPSPEESFSMKVQIVKNKTEIVAECNVHFGIGKEDKRTGSSPLQLDPEEKFVRLKFSKKYLNRIIERFNQKKGGTSESHDCIEGDMPGRDNPRRLDGMFVIRPRPMQDRAREWWAGPPVLFSAAEEVDRPDPSDVDAEVPPAEAGPAVIQKPAAAIPKPPEKAGEASQPAPEATSAPTENQIQKPAELAKKINSPPAAAPNAEPPVAQRLPSQEKITPAQPRAPVPKPLAPSGPQPSPAAAAKLFDLYLRGEDFDQDQLYGSWPEVQDYVVAGFRKAYQSGNPISARYINLIANALNEINGQIYRPPLRNPHFGGKIKPDRLRAKGGIPGFAEEDYKSIIDLLVSDNDDVRKAAQRLLRLFPTNYFYPPLQQYIKNNPTIGNDQFSRLNESAMFYFYNRIVEMQGSFPVDASVMAWIDGNFTNARQWLDVEKSRLPSQKLWAAMLLYAKGVVLSPRRFKDEKIAALALDDFRAMLDAIRNEDGDYPTNPQHIATALTAVEAPNTSTAFVDATKPYGFNDIRSLDGATYNIVNSRIPLHAIPNASSATLASVKPGVSARMILSADGWDLVQSAADLGWAQRIDGAKGVFQTSLSR